MSRMETKKIVSCFLGILSMLMVLVAYDGECASPGNPGQSPSSKPKYGGTMKIISRLTPTNLGIPSEPSAADDNAYSSPAVETLLNLDDEGNPAPGLATRWEVSDDLKSLTFFLRKGVKFHDGTDFNAEAVKYVLDLGREGARADLKTVTSIDIIDEYTVRLNFSQFANYLINSLTIAAGQMVSPTALKTHDKKWALMNPVGTGPFKLAKYERDTILRYEKFPGYWQKGKPYLDAIEFNFITDPMTALASFRNGDAHQMMRIDAKDAADLQATGKYEVHKVPLALYGFAPDGGNPKSPFADVRVRRAIEHAIDKDQIVKDIFHGMFVALKQTARPDGGSWNPDVKGYEYSPKKAKELLAEAGYPTGFKTKIIYRTFDLQHFFVAVQGYLKDVGIDATLEAVSMAQYNQIANKGWENTLLWWYMPCGKGMDPGQAFVRSLSRNATLFKSVLHPEEFDAVLSKAVIQRQSKETNLLYQNLTKMIHDRAMICPVYVGYNLAAWSPNLHDARLGETWPNKWTPENAWISK